MKQTNKQTKYSFPDEQKLKFIKLAVFHEKESGDEIGSSPNVNNKPCLQITAYYSKTNHSLAASSIHPLHLKTNASQYGLA